VLAVVVRISPHNGIDRFVFEWVAAWNVTLLAYPSGHTLGTIIQYALGIYLVFRLTLHRRLVVPLVALLALPIALVGPSRVLVRAHWSTDVLGAYLLGGASVIAVVLFLRTGEQRLADRGTPESLVRPTPGTSISERS
jgi:membrane-associated phospholipid phosphatase